MREMLTTKTCCHFYTHQRKTKRRTKTKENKAEKADAKELKEVEKRAPRRTTLAETAAKVRKKKEKESAKTQKMTVIADGNEEDKKVVKHKFIQERIADRGTKYVEGTTQHQMLVKCCLSDNTREWNDFAKLPIEAEFEQKFNLQHNIYTRTKKKSIFLKPDKFSTKKTASPRFLIEIHPTLARKEQVLADLCTMLECAHVEDNKHAMKYINASYPDWEWEVGYRPVPFFTVTQANRKFGNGRNWVETTVLHIECAEEDALYMKVLLVHVYENDSHFGKFIPNGCHLTHRAENYKNLLHLQNTYLNNISVVSVTGITEEALVQDNTVETEETMLMQCLLSGNFGIESIEETNHTEEYGKWFILYQKKMPTKFTTLWTICLNKSLTIASTKGTATQKFTHQEEQESAQPHSWACTLTLSKSYHKK
eukprot:15366132-Ditylum_brightwellii.AAC.2